MKKQHIALFVTGGIAAYKVPLLVRALIKAGHDVRVAMTKSAERFVTPETLAIVSKAAVLTDGHEFDHPEHVAQWHWHIGRILVLWYRQRPIRWLNWRTALLIML